MFEDFKTFFGKFNPKGPQEPMARGGNPTYHSQFKQILNIPIIAIANQKGGTGKTTTAINLSAALARKGFSTLLIDIDAQAHASLGLGVEVENLSYSIYDVMIKNIEIDLAILPTKVKNLDIIPATSVLTGAQLEIADLLGREMVLRTAIYKMVNTSQRNYDYIIIDCSPSLNLLTINSFVAATTLLVPIQTHYFSLEGMKELFSTIQIVKDRLNSELDILGILPTLFDTRTRMSRDILSQIKRHFKDKVFSTPIRMNIKLAEAQIHKKSIFEYDSSSNGAKDYLALTERVVELTQNQEDKVENITDDGSPEAKLAQETAEKIENFKLPQDIR